MVWWHAALWAVAGGFVVEGLEFTALVRKHRKWPWEVDAETAAETTSSAAGPAGYFLGELIRLIAGGVLGAAFAGQITGPLPALAVGVAAPTLIGHLLAYVPLPAESAATNAGGVVAAPAPTIETNPNNNGAVQPGLPQQVDPPAVTPEPLSEHGGTA